MRERETPVLYLPAVLHPRPSQQRPPLCVHATLPCSSTADPLCNVSLGLCLTRGHSGILNTLSRCGSVSSSNLQPIFTVLITKYKFNQIHALWTKCSLRRRKALKDVAVFLSKHTAGHPWPSQLQTASGTQQPQGLCTYCSLGSHTSLISAQMSLFREGSLTLPTPSLYPSLFCTFLHDSSSLPMSLYCLSPPRN